MSNYMFNEMSNEELYSVDGGAVGAIIAAGAAVIAFVGTYRDEIAKGLVDGYLSVAN